MKIRVQQDGEIVRTLEVEVPRERVDQEYERAFRRVAASVSFPGFRRGRVPRNLVEQRYGGEVRQEALETLLPQAALEAVRSQNLDMVGRPVIEHLDFEPGKPLGFRARIEVKPRVQIKGGLEGFKLRAPSAEVTDAEVEEQIQILRQRQAVIGAELERPAAHGDYLLVDFEGRIDGALFPGGQVKDYQVFLGRKQTIPGFEEGLQGARKGETRRLNIRFPEDYPAGDVAGKTAEFLVHVKECREVHLPEVDDAFAKSLGGVETALELRQAVRRAIEAQKQRLRRSYLQEEVARQLLETHVVPVPTAMIEAELMLMLDREVAALRARGLEPDGEKGLQSLAEQLRPLAERRARLSLILEAAADQLKIEVSEEEYLADLAKAASALQVSLETLRAQLARDGRDRGVRARLREEKALEWILSKAEVENA